MPLTHQQKQKIIEDLKEKIEKQKIMIFVNFAGLKVKDLFELRKKLKLTNAQLKVTKKTLFNIALNSYKSDLAQEVGKFTGQVATILGFTESILPAKIVYQFSFKNPNLKILGGYFEEKFREAQEIITLAQLPSRDELLAKFVTTIAASISNFVNVMEGSLKGLIFALSAIKNNKEQ
jgi:large subunit ribosomal protein L10